MNIQRKEYYEKLRESKKRLESKTDIGMSEKCALNEVNRQIQKIEGEIFFENMKNNNGRATIPKDNPLNKFIL